MKKFKILSAFVVLGCLISGCGCNKANEETYSKAVSTYTNSDAISFSRLEIVSTKGQDTELRKMINAKFIFNSDNNVSKMQYSRSDKETGQIGSATQPKTTTYYYSSNDGHVYTYIKPDETQFERYKEAVASYEDKFNVNTCEDNDKDCALLTRTNIAPIFNLNEVSDFNITGDGVATFKAVCPSFEHCSSNSEVLEYRVELNNDGNIGIVEYQIVNGDTTYSIKYVFDGYGSNNVKITFPEDLKNYPLLKK